MKLFVPKTNSAGPMNFQKKRCLGRIGGGNIKHLCVPAANLNYNSFQSVLPLPIAYWCTVAYCLRGADDKVEELNL
jgi:hypothetical protein